ncbi:MAG TPA: phage capsid protein [Desulfovibrio sp.]|nr:phage capsid protein [Desulfovibrio sp.]
MAKLVSEFIKIGQSGPTVDGRTIDAESLREAAETYDPSVYTASIWIDHFRFYGSYGTVEALKVVEEDGHTDLYAKLKPESHLVELNKTGQKRFTSMELQPNFAESGKHYLYGLGVTDQPASLGTHELVFSCRKHSEDNIILCGVELDMENLFQAEAGDSEEVPGWFKRFFSGVSHGRQPTTYTEPETPEEDSEEMNAEQFKQLNDSLGNLSDQFAAMAKTMSPEEGKGQGEPEPKTKTEEPSKEFSQLSGQLTELVTTVKEFTTRLEQANPGTNVPETHGAADQAKGGLL